MEHVFFSVLLLAIAFEGAFSQACEGVSCGGNEESRLIKDLFRSYDPIARPVKDVSQAVQAELGLALINIADVDEVNAAVTLKIWKRAAWTDEFLQWDAAAYGGVSQLSVPQKLMWNPDFQAYNALSEVHDEILHVIMNTGYVISIIPVSHKTQCAVTAADGAPTYTCSIKFGTWTRSKSQIEVATTSQSFPPVDTSDFVPHPTCQLVKSEGKIVEKTYEGFPETYQSLNVDLEIRC